MGEGGRFRLGIVCDLPAKWEGQIRLDQEVWHSGAVWCLYYLFLWTQ